MEKRIRIFNKSINNIFIALVYSNLWVSISVASLAQLSFLFYHQTSPTYLLFCFWATIFSYGYARLFQFKGEKFGSTQHVARWTISHKKWVLVISSVGLIGAISSWWWLPNTAKFTLIIGAIIALIYPLPSIFNTKGLRYLSGIKLLVIALVWTLTTLTVPALLSDAEWDLSLIFYHVERFAFILALTIPFDIRDANTDPVEMQTLPLWLGVRRSKQIGMALAAIAILALLFRYSMQDTRWFLPHLMVYILTASGNYFASHKRSDMYYSFWLEGLPTLLLLAVLLFELI